MTNLPTEENLFQIEEQLGRFAEGCCLDTALKPLRLDCLAYFDKISHA